MKKIRLLTNISLYFGNEQELSYRKQMARQPRTQYVKGIYDNLLDLEI